MSHIHTDNGHHDATVTTFIVRVDQAEPLFLLHMHKKYQKLMPAGGHIELDEHPWQTVAHEVEEETGYELANLTVFQPKLRVTNVDKKITIHPQPFLSNTHPVSDLHFHTDLDYLLIARDEPTKQVADDESNDIRWLSAVEAAQLGSDEIFENIKEIINFIDQRLLKSDDWEEVACTEYAF